MKPRVLTGGLFEPWGTVNTALVMAFVALLIVWQWGYAIIPLLATGVAIISYAVTAYDRENNLEAEDGLWLLSLSGFGIIWLADVVRTGIWPIPRGGEGMLLPLWPLLAAGLTLWLRRYPPSPRGWWLGLIIGAVGAVAIAVYERYWLGQARADNGMNAIPFGNIALLMGALSLITLLGRADQAASRNAWLTGLLGLAAVSGLLTSLLSGTRGGWIIIPVLICLAYRVFHTLLTGKRLLTILGFFILFMAGVTAMPQSGVSARLTIAIDEIYSYFGNNEKGSSVGLRLEMWRAGALLFWEKPLLGWGEGALQAARDAKVAAGELHSGVSRYDQLHSDIIDTAARRGVLGLLSLAGLYGIPLILFSRHLKNSEVPQVRALALSGLIVPIAFIDFGLSQSMLRDARGLSGYLGLSCICWALLKSGRSCESVTHAAADAAKKGRQ